jgi:orotidine-5'-phosphate decarboxylase
VEKNPIILALDTANLDEAINITKKIKDKICTVKLGLEFWNAFGKEGVKKFNQININNIFLDLKLADTPNTVKKSIMALDGINFEYLTVHSFAGSESIKKAKEAAKKLNPNLKILAVTLLTSIDETELKSRMKINSKVEDLVLNLAKNSSEADGFIASGMESKMLRENFPNHLIFTPGIRMPGDDRNEQKRVVSPAEALKYSDLIIMGRSLTSGDIEKNLSRVISSLKI